MKDKKINNLIICSFFFSYLMIGIYTLNDYGINIEEHTQIYSGYYWLNYIYEFFQIEYLSNDIKNKLNIISEDRQLPNPKIYTYGPAFDVTAAFLESTLNHDNEIFKFQLRHFLIFAIFFFSAIIFFKFLHLRFKFFFISFAGTLLYIFSPRIYGDSFHNNKDILFLSLVVFSFYFAFKLFKKIKFKNIILFSIFAALATSTRAIGLFLPVSIIMFIFFKYLNIDKKKGVITSFFLIFTYLLFLVLHWPYLWENPINNFFDFYTKSKSWIFSYFILFEGKYLLTNALPDYFIFKWIGITTPIFNLIIFILGIFFLFKRFSFRLISFNPYNRYSYDFWRSNNEMMDYFVFFNATLILLVILFLDVPFVSGWRHLYFLNFFIIYIGIFFLYLYRVKIKKYNQYLTFLFIIFFSFNVYKLILFHPYQSLYFNEFLMDKDGYLVDRDGLSRLDSINKVISFSEDRKIINIANSSFIPYYRIKEAFSQEIIKKIKFVGREYDQADFIFNNFVYEVNPKYNDKYHIPNNFEQIYVLEIDGIKIYEIYRRIKSK